MVVCIDKATAVRTFDKVSKYWKQEIEVLKKELDITHEEKRAEIESKIHYMEKTDMAVVVSQSQNEIDEMSKKGLDIVPHRKRMIKEDLDTKFKDPDDLFRIVFVCAMWMTGFDVPSCSTIYLDKPMRNHTLMQTIARANRVFRDKVNGLIVDYVGVFRNLQKALAIYGSGSGGGVNEGDTPVKDKAALVEQLSLAIGEATAFCVKQGIDLEVIKGAEGFEQIKLLDNAVDAILVNDDSKRDYLLLAANVNKLYKAILPDPAAKGLAPTCILFDVIAQKIRSLTPPPDISGVMGEVEKLLDDSIAAEGYVIREPSASYGTGHLVDLSKIDFEALKARFEQGQRRTEAEKLKGKISSKLNKMVRLNRTRMDYLERFQRMIYEYNAGSMNIDEFFKRLLSFAQGLNEEEKRGISEQLTEEELAIFDLLTRPKISLTKVEERQVKKAGEELLEVLKREKLVLDWRKRQQSRAQVRVTIEDIFDRGLPQAFTPELYQKKCDAVYQHVYDSYYGAGKSVYSFTI
ncbi:MAG: DUF3387 domain-containing protein [Thermodesulfobacteriota bacterium]|nr:DUF3387 domain-containing protein [Thermodesulfobacteriota bacterium]